MFKRFDYYKPTLGESWALVALFLIGSLGLGLVLGVLKLIFPSSDIFTSTTLSYVCSLALPFFFIFIASGVKRKTGNAPVPMNSCNFGRMGAVRFFIVISLALLSLTVLLDPVVNLIPMPDYFKQLFETVFSDSLLWDAILSTCILAPLCEEFLCRGIILRGLLREMSPVKAILWSAFIFAFIHMNPWQAIVAFAIGIFFGWVYWKSGCLWATVFLHFLNNSVSTLLTRVIPELDVDSSWIDIMPKNAYIALLIASGLIFVASIAILYKNYDEKTISSEV